MPTLDIATVPAESTRVPLAVVVDVLRATTTLTEMLDRGCPGVRPVRTVEEAFALRREDPDLCLAGERGGVAPEGFDLGNSPVDDRLAAVPDRRVVLTTTNGTQAFARAATDAKGVIAMSLTNLPAVADRLASRGDDVCVLCSGTDGGRSVEDELAAGLLAERMGPAWRLTARAKRIRDEARLLTDRLGGVDRAVASSWHAERLVGLGFGGDVAFCGRVGTTKTVPRLHLAGSWAGWIRASD